MPVSIVHRISYSLPLEVLPAQGPTFVERKTLACEETIPSHFFSYFGGDPITLIVSGHYFPISGDMPNLDSPA